MRPRTPFWRIIAVVVALAAAVGIVSASPGPSAAWTGDPLAWVQFGGATGDVGRTVVPLSDGGLVVGGFFSSTVAFGSTTLTSAGSDDAFVARLGATGEVLWVVGFGGASVDVVTEVAVDGSGAVTAVGFFGGSITIGSTTLTSAGSRDGFVARFDANGNAEWALRFGGSSVDSAHDVVAAPDGDVIVGGIVSGAATFASSVSVPVGSGQGDSDVVVVRLSAAGGIDFLERLGGTDQESFGGLAVGPSGEVFVGGTFASSTMTIASSTVVNVGAKDGFVAELAANGVPLWSASCGGVGQDGVAAVAVDATGGVYVFGEVDGAANCGSVPVAAPLGGVDLLLARFDGDGTTMWAQRYGGGANEEARQVARGPDGVLVLAGTTGRADDPSMPFVAAFVVAVDPGETVRWTATMGGSGYDVAQGVSVDADGYVVVALRFGGGDLDPGPGDLQVTTAGASDALFVTLAPDGSLAPVVRPRPPVAPAYTG